VVAFLIGIEETGNSSCDGPCFDKWDDVQLVSVFVGSVGAVMFGLATRRLLRDVGSHKG
jgi:hypothetical protein